MGAVGWVVSHPQYSVSTYFVGAFVVVPLRELDGLAEIAHLRAE
jgi:hypothetical protein